jgi:DNA-binding LacI/PurR family transcriptional regulator
MGYVATQMLIKLVSGENLDAQIYKMPTKLVIRGSCQALAVTV